MLIIYSVVDSLMSVCSLEVFNVLEVGGLDRSKGNDQGITSGLTRVKVFLGVPVVLDESHISFDLLSVHNHVLSDGLGEFDLAGEDLGPGLDSCNISQEVLTGGELSRESRSEFLESGNSIRPVVSFGSLESLGEILFEGVATIVAFLNFREVVVHN